MNTKIMVNSALAGVFALGMLAGAQAVAQDKPEKCYGIAKAGKNDCQTANASCAGTSHTDKQSDAWIYVPKGTCEKIVGGTLQPT